MINTSQPQHTPEPWKLPDIKSPCPQILGNKGEICKVWPQYPLDLADAKANARRIVQCVNACAGIENPEALPELLEAVQYSIDIIKGEFCYSSCVGCEHCGPLVKAMEKLKLVQKD